MSVYRRGSRGLEVTRLEIALREHGLYRLAIDDIFGAGMEEAVRAFQRERGLPVTGEVDEALRRRILAIPSPRLEAVKGKPTQLRTLALTAGFETSASAPECFAGLAGDFDGQGISFGALQWNLGQGTLQPLLKRMDAEHPEVLREAFGDEYPVLKDVLEKPRPEQLAWARSIQGSGKRTLVEPWRSHFRALGRTEACQAVQSEASSELFGRARGLCARYGLWSERGLALMFDIVVQNGSIRDATAKTIFAEMAEIPGSATDDEQEVARMRIIGNRRAEAARPQYIEDVRRRKLTIAEGVGIVHGVGYDLERQFLVRLFPFQPEEVEGPTAPVPAPA